MNRNCLPMACFSLLYFLVAMTASVSIAQKATIKPAPKTGQILKIGITQQILTLDPQKAYDLGSLIIANAVGETLYRKTAGGRIEFILAKSLPIPVSGNKYRITLNKAARFHSGELLSPRDVIFTLERLKDSRLTLPAAPFFSKIRFLSQIDETHLDCVFSGSADELVASLCRTETIILSQKRLSLLGKAGIMGSGTFFLNDWQRGEQIVLKKYEPYWGNALLNTQLSRDEENTGQHQVQATQTTVDKTGKKIAPGLLPFLGQVSLVMVTKSETLYKKLLNRSIHVAIGLQPEHAARFSRNDNRFTRTLFPSHRVYQLYLNRETPPLDQVEVRKALSWAINRQQLVLQCLAGYGQPLDSPLLPGMLDTVPTEVSNCYSHQPEHAIEALQQAGFFENSDPEPLILIVTYDPLLQAIALEIQKQCLDIGLSLSIVPLSKHDLFNTVYKRGLAADITWHIALEDWHDWRMPTDPIEFLKLQFQSNSKYNKTGFSDGTVDQIFRDMSSELRFTALSTILKRIAEDCSVIPLVSPYRIMAHSQRLQDLSWDRNGILYLERCWIKE